MVQQKQFWKLKRERHRRWPNKRERGKKSKHGCDKVSTNLLELTRRINITNGVQWILSNAKYHSST
jgi:hypothetical protein